MKDVLEALERHESVRILYHGCLKGTVVPILEKRKGPMPEHPFFGMKKGEKSNVTKQMDALRRGRFDSL